MYQETKHKNTVRTPDGEIVDSSTGEVLGYATDRGPEWRAFDDDQRAKRTRVGAPSTYTVHDKGLSTAIDWHDRDIYGKSLTSGQKSQFYRLRKWHRRTRVSDSAEKSLSNALADIVKTSKDIALPTNVIETASVNYRKAAKDGL